MTEPPNFSKVVCCANCGHGDYDGHGWRITCAKHDPIPDRWRGQVAVDDICDDHMQEETND